MHTKDKKAFEQIDAMMMNSDAPEQNYAEIEGYVLRWKQKLDEIAAEANNEREKHEEAVANEEYEGHLAELLAKDGFERIGPIGTNLVLIPGDTDGPRRTEDPMDYNRAQPTEDDARMVNSFIDREFAREDVDRYQKSQVSRKMGLLIAMQFNRGFDAGVESVRKENGYSKGYDYCLEVVKTRINGLVPMAKKKSGRKPKRA